MMLTFLWKASGPDKTHSSCFMALVDQKVVDFDSIVKFDFAQLAQMASTVDQKLAQQPHP